MLRARAVLSLWCAAGLGACAANIPPVPMDAFEAGDFNRIEGFFQDQLDHGDANSRALFLNGLAQSELLAGDRDAARRNFAEAGRIMGNWSASSGEVTGAIVGQEGSKTWKGDPHERAMNCFYLGVLYWWKGEPDNARAAFKAGILADAESDEGEAQVDFALLYWLAGRASLEMGLRGDADQFFGEARTAREFAVENGARGASSSTLLTDPSRGNLIVLAELGIGPRKVPSGQYAEMAVVEPRPVTYDSAEVFVDGQSQGPTTLLADIDYQARTRGGREMAGIREGKAVFKDITGNVGAILLLAGANDSGQGQRDKLLIGGALLLVSLFTRPEADVRHWETLPQTVHALIADVPPGRHEVRIAFSGPGRRSGLEQTWSVDVPEHGDTLLLFRSLPTAGPPPAQHP